MKEPKWFKELRPEDRISPERTYIGTLGVKGYEKYYKLKHDAYNKPTARLLLAYNLMRLRCEKRLSVTSLAKEPGISRQKIYMFEKGLGNSMATAEKLANALGVKFTDLFQEVCVSELMKAVGY